MLIVDAHLDLAYNACSRGRDPRMPAKDQPAVEGEIATVGFPDLRAGNVGLVCATIFCEPAGPTWVGGYTTAEEARTQAIRQLGWYRSCIEQGLMRFVLSSKDLPEDADASSNPLAAILLMEGADALRAPEDMQEWFDQGLRIVGLSWRRTRLAGGTGAPGPITAEGRRLVEELDRLGIIHDASHLAEESFWNLMDLTEGPVIASHSNCRSIVGEGDRHLSDDMILAIAKRGGVIGINFFDKFLLPKDEYGKRRATLDDVLNHIKHICDLTGSAKHVAIGTDMDGGLGREQIPQEIQTSADMPKIRQAMANARFPSSDIAAVMSGNWFKFFSTALA